MGIMSLILEIIYPNKCGFCGAEISKDKLICHECAGKLRLDYYIGKPKDIPGENPIELLMYAGIYSGHARRGVLRLKDSQAVNVIKYLSITLIDKNKEKGLDGKIDYIAFVPMSRGRESKRGFNQAELIAKHIAGELSKPILYDAICKRGRLLSQHKLKSYRQRQLHAGSSYYLKRGAKRIDGCTVLLCDDVITSGSTLASCSELLKELGAKRIFAFTLLSSRNHR